jgi:hypothetical protein
MRDQVEVIVKLRPFVVAIGAATMLGGTGALVLPGVASARAVTHTVVLTSVQDRQVNFTRNRGILSDRDVNKAGRVVGYDTVRFSFNHRTDRTTFGVALNLERGFVYGVLTEHGNNPVMRGRISWGTGIFHAVAGTITARNLNSNGTRTAVVIRYHHR